MDKTIIFLHGYGVRGWFWDGFTDHFRTDDGGAFARILTPNLNMVDVDTLLDTTTELVKREAAEHGPVCLVGHSLGGAVASVVAHRLGKEAVAKIACIATPYGGGAGRFGWLIKFLIKHRMIPDFMARPQFYSRKSPEEVQKALFAKAVPESDALQETIFAGTYFHTAILTQKLDMPAFVVCSARDKVVPYTQSEALAQTLGARLFTFEASEQVAHDDFVAAPTVIEKTQSILSDFFR